MPEQLATALLEAMLIIIVLGGLEITLWWVSRKDEQKWQEEQANTFDSLLQEMEELTDSVVERKGEIDDGRVAKTDSTGAGS